MGEYDGQGNILVSSAVQPEDVPFVIWHESAHWVVRHASASVRTAIQKHFVASTKGFPIETNSQTGVRFIRDHWIDFRAGIIYDDADTTGREVLPVYLDFSMSQPKEIAKYQLYPNWGETFDLVLSILKGKLL